MSCFYFFFYFHSLLDSFVCFDLVAYVAGKLRFVKYTQRSSRPPPWATPLLHIFSIYSNFSPSSLPLKVI